MLSVNLIERAVENQDHDRLLRELADNGLPMPWALRLRLSQGSVSPLALALRRLVDLTYGPTALSRELVEGLLFAQNPDGSFPGESDRDPLATAAAVAAWSRVVDEHAQAPDELRPAIARGLQAIADFTRGDGLFWGPSDRCEADAAATTAFIIYLLGPYPAFLPHGVLTAASHWFDANLGRLDRATADLWELAAATTHPEPAMRSLPGQSPSQPRFAFAAA